MHGITVENVANKKQLKDFIFFPYKLYADNPYWVAPLISDMKKTVAAEHNTLFKRGMHRHFMVYKDGKAAGRITACVDEELNAAKGSKDGYVSMFECMEDRGVAKALFDAACGWLKEKGITYVKGPISPTGGDDYRGLLINNFDSPPTIMNSYNMPYYKDYFEENGFEKYQDLCGYFFDGTGNLLTENRIRASKYAMKRYNFTVDALDMKNLENELMDIKRVLDIAMPPEWEDLIPPSFDDIKAVADSLGPIADPDIIYIARSEGKPIGFSVALPDYNQVLIKLKGRLFPFGFIKYMLGKKKINTARIFILFVIPEFRKKGVSGTILVKTIMTGTKKGYFYGEGSTIGETNLDMRRDAEGAGGILYKIYRLYGKKL